MMSRCQCCRGLPPAQQESASGLWKSDGASAFLGIPTEGKQLLAAERETPENSLPWKKISFWNQLNRLINSTTGGSFATEFIVCTLNQTFLNAFLVFGFLDLPLCTNIWQQKHSGPAPSVIWHEILSGDLICKKPYQVGFGDEWFHSKILEQWNKICFLGV